MSIRTESLCTTIGLTISEKEAYDGSPEKEIAKIRIDFYDVSKDKRERIEEASRKFLNQIANFLTKESSDRG